MANSWYDQIESKFAAGIAHTFVIHGNTQDYIDIGGNYVPLQQAIAHLMHKREVVVFYNRSSGWRFRTKAEQKIVEEILKPAPVPGASPLQAAAAGAAGPATLPKAPTQAMSQFEKLLKADLKIAIVIEYAESVFASAKWDGAGAAAELGTLVVTLLRWAKDDEIHEKANPVILLCSDSFESLHPSLRSPEAKVEPILVSYPNREERLKFIKWYSGKKKINMNGVTPDQLAHMTSALSLLMIEDILLRSDQEGILEPTFVRDRKDEIIRAEYSDILAVPEARDGWESFSDDFVKNFFVTEVIEPLRAGDKLRCPMSVMMMGPPGTAKSVLAKVVAKESGMNYMEVYPGRLFGGIQGTTEHNTERLFRAMLSNSPCIVFIDEFDKAVPQEDAYQGDSGTGSRFLQRLQDFSSNPRHRGEIVFLVASNRPDRISAALKRAGRFGDVKIAILPPADNAARVALMKTMFAKYQVKYTGTDKKLTEVAEKMDDYVGADIELIVRKACKISKSDGAVGSAEMEYAVDCIIPTVSPEDVKYQTALAIKECSDRSLLPPKYRMKREDITAVISEHKDRKGGREL